MGPMQPDFDPENRNGKKSGTSFLVVQNQFRKVFWIGFGTMNHNPTGYDEYHVLCT